MSGIKIATRDAVGPALVELGEENDDIVVLDADLCESTKTVAFKKRFPSRFFDCGIAESNMIGVAAGLSSVGKIPFAASFAMFVAGRAYEQIRNSVGYTNLNVKIIGSHCGFSSAQDGATHQCIEDIALMRAIPNMVVLSPCDFVETTAAIKKAAYINGPVYIRTSKFAVDVMNDEEYVNRFKIGQGVVLKEGEDVCLIATGIEVFFALKAAKVLEEQGISTMVVNIHTIKPLDEELILEVAKKVKFVFTVEEHSIIGGLGEAVSSCLAEKQPKIVTKIAINDRFGESAKAEQLLLESGLDELGIVKKVKEFFFKKMFKKEHLH